MPSPDERRRSGARVDAELGVDVFEVLPHGSPRDPEALGDLGVRLALGYEIQDLLFARRERREPLILLEEQRAVDELDHERLAARADGSQTPVATACPAGYENLSVASLEAAGPYIVPRLVDTAGNRNGYVCGLALPDSVRAVHCKHGGLVACILAELGLPLYEFKDEDNPASQNAVVDV
jgi:hypothetical protein